MQDDQAHDHGRGLAFDLETIGRRMIERRRALAWLAGGGTALVLAGCGGSGTSGDGTTTSTAAETASTTASTTTSSGTTTSATTTTGTTASCIADPTETSGPYPADGTNTSSGSTSDVLTQSGIVRSDIRSSFISSTTTAAGVQVSLTLTLVDASSACAPLSGYAIYIWHCDAAGEYSLYTAPTESYLRGVQVTDANGPATFETIFPASYDGRYPHMHIEVYRSVSSATSGKNALLVTQLAMPADICNLVYADTSLYPSAASIFATVSESTDLVFGDNTAAQLAQQTPSFSGSVAAGYTATNTIGIAI